MEKNLKIKCPCGQVTYLKLSADGKWHYDARKHGSEADSEGKCFNCFAPLKSKTIADTKAKAEAEAEAARVKADQARAKAEANAKVKADQARAKAEAEKAEAEAKAEAEKAEADPGQSRG